MAIRNLAAHKAKSLIVGTLLALGVLILVLGNSFLDASRRGIERSFTRNYTADLIVTGKANGPVSLFGVQSVGGLEETPIVPEYEKVFEHIASLPGVAALTGSASSFGLITSEGQTLEMAAEEEGDDEEDASSAFVMLFGVDAQNYWSVFPTLEMVHGSFIEPGKPGIMVEDSRLERISKRLKREVKVGDEILIQGLGATGIRLRSVPIVGTYRQPADGANPEQLSYIDIDTLRVLAGMTVGANATVSLSAEQTELLQLDDLDSLFNADFFALDEAETSTPVSFDLNAILGDTSVAERLNEADRGAWHSILVRLEPGRSAKAVVAELNAWFAQEGIAAEAGDWQKAAGPYAQSVDVLRIVFTIAIVILAVVAIIIIMNTMVVSVIERTGEIGTMRAVGAGRGFVRAMFAAETAVLSLAFGVVGVALSFITAGILNAVKIEAGNQFFEILFGGKLLSLLIDPVSVVLSLVMILAVGLVAHFYPVAVALRIQPVRAMQTE
jgi:putative ABC transport system permease protein